MESSSRLREQHLGASTAQVEALKADLEKTTTELAEAQAEIRSLRLARLDEAQAAAAQLRAVKVTAASFSFLSYIPVFLGTRCVSPLRLCPGTHALSALRFGVEVFSFLLLLMHVLCCYRPDRYHRATRLARLLGACTTSGHACPIAYVHVLSLRGHVFGAACLFVHCQQYNCMYVCAHVWGLCV